MGQVVIKSSLFLILLCQIAHCVRISPKLDFGNDNNAPDNAKFRPIFQSRSSNYGDRELGKRQEMDIICASGNCNVTDKQNGVVTDVVVQIKTKAGVDANNNTINSVPDIPIIVGTKPKEFPSYNSPNVYSDLPPPFPINNLIRNGVQQSDLSSGSDYNYASGYQGSVADLYPVYNKQNPNINNIPHPQFTSNNQERLNGGVNYNPIEFKKVYHNSWADLPIRRMEGAFPNIGQNNPTSWTPCICQNPEEQYYQSTYPRY